jgi:hypothetical protein
MELGTAVIVVIGAMIVLVPRGVGEGITTNIEKRFPVQGSELPVRHWSPESQGGVLPTLTPGCWRRGAGSSAMKRILWPAP